MIAKAASMFITWRQPCVIRDDKIPDVLKYNESSDLVSVTSENYSETRKYQYDEKGNWVVCFIYDSEHKLKSVIQKVIIYGNRQTSKHRLHHNGRI